MRIAVLGYGSIWSQRVDPRGRRTAYFNTTGVRVGAHVRHRACVYGVARFNGNCGFSPHFVERSVGSVFECSELCSINGANRIVFTERHAVPVKPDAFLVVLTNELPGRIDFETAWYGKSVRLLSCSQDDQLFEALVVMPVYGWVKGETGIFYLEPQGPSPCHPRLVRVPGV
jgi:hypothetical protein